jgi:hypothetical protein
MMTLQRGLIKIIAMDIEYFPSERIPTLWPNIICSNSSTYSRWFLVLPAVSANASRASRTVLVGSLAVHVGVVYTYMIHLFK